MKLYVIGPVLGKEDDNRAEFERVKEALYEAGYEVVIPHDFIPSDVSHAQAMMMSIHRMTSYDGKFKSLRKCYAVAMLDDWRESPGARLEHDIAQACGIICKPWTDWL